MFTFILKCRISGRLRIPLILFAHSSCHVVAATSNYENTSYGTKNANNKVCSIFIYATFLIYIATIALLILHMLKNTNILFSRNSKQALILEILLKLFNKNNYINEK